MKTVQSLLLFFILLWFVSFPVQAEEKFRYRYLYGYHGREQGVQDQRNNSSDFNYEARHTVSAFDSFHFVTPSGLGGGITLLNRKYVFDYLYYHFNGTDYELVGRVMESVFIAEEQLIDLTYTLGTTFTVTLGAGFPIGGSGKHTFKATSEEFKALYQAIKGESFSEETVHVETNTFTILLFLLGYDFEGIEFLLGTRLQQTNDLPELPNFAQQSPFNYDPPNSGCCFIFSFFGIGLTF